MKNKIMTMFSSMSVILLFTTAGFADNPIIQTNYTADPAPMVHNDTVYLYTSHDEDDAISFHMLNWMCYTTTDMVNWTDHGIVASLQNFSWQAGNAWAPEGIYRNGKWYLYCPLTSSVNGNQMAVGVLTSNSPFGPFTDPIGKPLVCCSYDPTVFIDSASGQAYLYWGGNGPCYWVMLNADMISVANSNQTASINVSGCPTTASYQEGPWLDRKGNNYYLAWASDCCPEGIGYAMSSSPMGPWTCKGLIMNTDTASSGNHPGLVMNYKGNSYVFGFDYELQKLRLGTKVGERRSICVKPMTFNSDGTIVNVPWWGKGAPLPSVTQVGNLNPYDTTQAETICWEVGVRTEVCSEGGLDVDSIHNGDFIKVKGVNFGSGGAKSFNARVASATSGGRIELHLDTTTGTLVGTDTVAGTGGWQTWTTKSCTVSGATGVHDLYFKFTGGTGLLFNFNWWKFTSATGIRIMNGKNIDQRNFLKVRTCSGSTTSLYLDFDASVPQGDVRVCLFDLTGRLATVLFAGRLSSSQLVLPVNRAEIRNGIYVIKASLNDKVILMNDIMIF